MKKKRILAINGSTRSASTNRMLIDAISDKLSPDTSIQVLETIALLPQFNPDRDTETPPPEVERFRNALRNADGILICTPEYAMGVPGTLKNAIDWTVSSMEFSKRPTALITASTLGHKAHLSLQETLKVIEAGITDETSLVISHIKTKVSEGKIVDPATETAVQNLMTSFLKMIDSQQRCDDDIN